MSYPSTLRVLIIGESAFDLGLIDGELRAGFRSAGKRVQVFALRDYDPAVTLTRTESLDVVIAGDVRGAADPWTDLIEYLCAQGALAITVATQHREAFQKAGCGLAYTLDDTQGIVKLLLLELT